MPPRPPVMMALTTVAMMVAMMLPSIAPTLWRHHHHLRAMHIPHAGQRTILIAAGYASVWVTIGLALFAMRAELSPMATTVPTGPAFVPLVAGAVVLCAGALQRSGWKAKQLCRCRHACVTSRVAPTNTVAMWRAGCRLGVACGLSCTAPMAVLFVGGLMDPRLMAVVTAAITAERVTPAGERIARLTGALALLAGWIMCVRAITVAMSGVA